MVEDKYNLFFVFDVESVGLYGEGFAVGWSVVCRQGAERGYGRLFAEPNNARAWKYASQSEAIEAREWLRNNVPLNDVNFGGFRSDTYAVCKEFWANWRAWEERGAVMVADCPWPVEANFLMACLGYPWSGTNGPYPLIDVASVRLAAGLDPIETCPRLAAEQPNHDPLADARQSARLLIEAMDAIHATNAGGAR